MNTAHWHLVLNHLPIVGVIIGTLVLAAGFLRKGNSTVKNTALGIFVFAGLSAVPSYLTGEGAEEVVESLPGITEASIEAHEELAMVFLILAGILGAISVLTLAAQRYKPKFVPGLYILILLFAAGVCYAGQKVGTSGGEIHHSEIRAGADQVQGNEAGGAEEDDDD